jgi:hypothetical protein
MKRQVSILIVVVQIYFLTAIFIAVPYFNWQYAREHGFASWVAFGEIIATAKACVWPVYVVAGSRSAGSSSGRHYDNSKQACDEAMTIIVRFGGVAQLPPGETANVAQLLQTAAAEAGLVDDSYLKQVHPDFAKRYRQEYTVALRNLSDGIRTSNRFKQISAAGAYNSFSEWISKNEAHLSFPR